MHREGSWCRTAADWSDDLHGHDLSGNCSGEWVFSTRTHLPGASDGVRSWNCGSANNARTESPRTGKRERLTPTASSATAICRTSECGGRPWSRSLPWDRTGAGQTNERASQSELQSSRADSSHGDAARLTLLSNGWYD